MVRHPIDGHDGDALANEDAVDEPYRCHHGTVGTVRDQSITDGRDGRLSHNSHLAASPVKQPCYRQLTKCEPRREKRVQSSEDN